MSKCLHLHLEDQGVIWLEKTRETKHFDTQHLSYGPQFQFCTFNKFTGQQVTPTELAASNVKHVKHILKWAKCFK